MFQCIPVGSSRIFALYGLGTADPDGSRIRRHIKPWRPGMVLGPTPQSVECVGCGETMPEREDQITATLVGLLQMTPSQRCDYHVLCEECAKIATTLKIGSM